MRFDLTGANDRELPLILGLMPVLAKHAVDPETFEETTFEPIVGSGPYVIAKVDAGPQHLARSAIPNYWGRDLADQPRPVEFRRGPLRLLPRRQFASRGIQAGPLRRAHRNRSRPLADGLRLPARARRPRRQGDIPERPAEDDLRLRLQHAAAGLRRHPRARSDRRCCSTSNGSTTTYFYRSLPRARRATSKAPSFRRRAGRPTRASARCSRHFPTPCAPTSWTAHGRRR